MSLFGMFKKTERLVSLADLQAFCARHALCSARKDMTQFVEQRIEIMPQEHLEPHERRDALNRACWRAYPVALLNILEMLSTVFRTMPQTDLNQQESEAVLRHIAVDLMQAELLNQPFAAHVWRGYELDICAQLSGVYALPIKPIRDIPRARVRSFCALMPLHPDVLLAENTAIDRHLQVKICRAHDLFVQAVEWQALLADIKHNMSHPNQECPPSVKAADCSLKQL